jgi:hypothetical protein
MEARAQRSSPRYEHQYSRLDLDFPGGTVAEYLERVRQGRPDGAANVVVMPEAKALRVPPVTLVAVTVEAAVQLLEGPYSLPDGREARISVASYTIGDSSDLVMKVMAECEPVSIRASVWNVEEALTNGQDAEELLGAIEAVLSLFPEKAEVSYHPPTRLLIARGTDEQLDLVREAIDQLTDSAQSRRERIESLSEELDEWERELHEVTGEIKVAEKTLSIAKAQFTKAAKRHEEGIVRVDAVAEAELGVIQVETELENYKVRHLSAQEKIESLRAALKKLREPRE